MPAALDFPSCPRQLDRFIHSGRRHCIHVQCLCQSTRSAAPARQLGDGLFVNWLYDSPAATNARVLCKNARGKGKAASRLIQRRRCTFSGLASQHKVGVASSALMDQPDGDGAASQAVPCQASGLRPRPCPPFHLPPGRDSQQRDSAVFSGNRQRLQGQHGAGGCRPWFSARRLPTPDAACRPAKPRHVGSCRAPSCDGRHPA